MGRYYFFPNEHTHDKSSIKEEVVMGFIDGILLGVIEGRQQAKQYAKSQAYAHLQSMSDQINVMQRVCENSSCMNCKYGTSPSNCEYHARIDLYNETLDDYAQRKLVRKG